MTVEQVKDAIRAQCPVRIQILSLMREVEYKRIICMLPLREGEEIPMAVLEDRCGHSVSYARITQIMECEPDKKENAPAAAYA